MKPRRSSSPGAPEGEGELNTVPYLDILMNLILFMLLSLTGLVPLGVVSVSARPSLPPGAGANADAGPTVVIGPSGFNVFGGEPATTPGPAAAGSPDIPRTATGDYDFAALTSHLERLKLSRAAGSRLLLVAAADTPYETVIATMDACRQTSGHAGHSLFPDVSLGAL